MLGYKHPRRTHIKRLIPNTPLLCDNKQVRRAPTLTLVMWLQGMWERNRCDWVHLWQRKRERHRERSICGHLPFLRATVPFCSELPTRSAVAQVRVCLFFSRIPGIVWWGFFVAGNLVADNSSVIFSCNIRLRSLIKHLCELFPLQNFLYHSRTGTGAINNINDGCIPDWGLWCCAWLFIWTSLRLLATPVLFPAMTN